MAVFYEHSIDILTERLSRLNGVGSEDIKINTRREAKISLAFAEAAAQGGFRRGEGTLFCFTSKKYIRLLPEDLTVIVGEVMKRVGIGVVYSVNSVGKAVKTMINSYNIPIFEPSKSIISFRNCVLDIDTMRSYKHDERFMTRIFFNFDYNASARCPNWRKFCGEVIQDEASIEVMQEFFGMMFIDRKKVKIAKSLYLYGTGSNGKSVVQAVISTMLGTDNCSTFSLRQLCTDYSADYNCAVANGKLLNFTPDMGDKDYSGGKYKAISDYEPIWVRPIGMAPFQADDMPLLAANVNKIPISSDSSDGHWRRHLIIRFDKKFEGGNEDKFLIPKLLSEASGIFNWIIEGRNRLLENKGQFTKSKVIEDTLAIARLESSTVLSWCKECRYVAELKEGQKGEKMRMFMRNMLEDYTSYCRSGNNIPKSKFNFKADLVQSGFKYRDSMRIGGNVSTGFEFYQLEEEAIFVKNEGIDLDYESSKLPF